jgi:hypothetical protein
MTFWHFVDRWILGYFFPYLWGVAVGWLIWASGWIA